MPKHQIKTLIAATFATVMVSGLTHAQEGRTTIYSISNKAAGNTIVAWTRRGQGPFLIAGEYATGGKGTGALEIPALKQDPSHPLANGDDPLISARTLTATADGRFAVAVNPGNATISLMQIGTDGAMTSAGIAPASDLFPVSTAIFGDLVAVSSVGKDNNNGSIATYRIANGKLAPIEGSRRDLKARPSTIAFTSNGKHVVVDELVTGKVKVFGQTNGKLSDAPISVIDSPRDKTRFQAVPVDLLVKGKDGDDVLIVSEARFLTPEFELRKDSGKVVQSPLYSWQTGSISTYKITGDGKISLVSGDVLTGKAVEGGQIANCWITLSADGSVLYAANALSSSLTSFSLDASGKATIRDETAYKDASEKLFFGDLVTSPDGKQLFQHIGNQGRIMVLNIQENGKLIPTDTLDGLPALGAYGLLVLSGK